MTTRPEWRFADPDDPFGSCPDEKPPAGWNEGFWEGVREKIERSGGDPGADGIPEPPGRKRRAVVTALAVLIGATSGLCVLLHEARTAQPDRPVENRVLVRVTADREPPVVVDWARRSGSDSSFVVLESVGPQISYLMLDPPQDSGAGPQPCRIK